MTFKRSVGLSVLLLLSLTIVMSWRLWSDAGEAERFKHTYDEKITHVRRQIERYQDIPEGVQQTFETNYEETLNKLLETGKVLNLQSSFEVGAASEAFDVADVKSLSIQMVYSGIANRSRLISLLEALDFYQQDVPFLLQEVIQEKDTLRVKFVVLGV